MRGFVLLAVAFCWPCHGQQVLTLRQAVETALNENKTLAAAQASVSIAKSGIDEARAGRLPKVRYSESLTRSNNPVFVFGSLLTQHQFTANNFELGSLNRPEFLDDFQSAITAEQVLFDGGKTRDQVRLSTALEEMARQDDGQARTETILSTVRAYLDAAVSREAVVSAEKSLRSAEADLAHAEDVRRVGLSTDADVLSIRVHLARVREQKIKREAELAVAQASLDDVLGVPLDVTYQLVSPFSTVNAADSSESDLEKVALVHRPEQRRMSYAAQAAQSQVAGARSALLPTLVVRGEFEEDRQTFMTRGAPNWTGSIALNWNIFDGSNQARIAAASASLLRAHAEQERMSSAVRLEVRKAWEQLRAADQQVEVSKSTVEEAEESLRITQNRYGAGLTTVTDLLRTESAVMESRIVYLSALHDRFLATVVVDAACGTLTANSPSLQE